MMQPFFGERLRQERIPTVHLLCFCFNHSFVKTAKGREFPLCLLFLYQGLDRVVPTDDKPYAVSSVVVRIWATVQLASPTLKRAKRRTMMFSPSLPTFCAINWLMVTVCYLMKGCSSRQTSS